MKHHRTATASVKLQYNVMCLNSMVRFDDECGMVTSIWISYNSFDLRHAQQTQVTHSFAQVTQVTHSFTQVTHN